MTQLNRAAKPCDYCNSATALLFCRTDAAFMCMSCDAKVHFTTGERHARVWTCEVCEQAPAAVTCKADAAALCVKCDRDIHAANPLSRRHERVAVVPFFDTAETVVLKSAVAGDVFPAPPMDDVKIDTWVFPDSTTTVPSKFNSDQFLEFDSYGISSQPYSDSVVPVQTSQTPILNQFNNDYSSETRFEIDFTRSNISLYNNTTSYTTPSLSVSSSSIDVGVVPNGGSLSDISFPFVKNPIANMDPNQGSQVVGMDREARVMRYREKRMNRKFEKTVRYASRKAYAETRPRVKGRFAKKTDTESEIERMFCDG